MSVFRPGVRMRLTLAYGGLFLLAGAILLGLNYALVKRSLPVTKAIDVTFAAPVPKTGVLIAKPDAVFQVPVGVTGGAALLDPSGNPVPGTAVGGSAIGGASVAGPPAGGASGLAGAIAGGKVLVTTGPNGEQFVASVPAMEPLTTDGIPVSKVVRNLAGEVRADALSELLVKSLQALGVMGVVSIGLGWAVAGRVLGPLHRMTATARKLSEENLHERIALDGPDDEMKELADTFDAMLGRLEGAFESQKRFVANASHELRTPLAVMRAEIDVALADPGASPEELRTMAETVRSAVDRSDALIDGLLVLARSDRGVAQTELVDLADVAGDVVAQAQAEARAARVELHSTLSPAPVAGDRALLARLAGNLIENAIRHNVTDGTGFVEVTTEQWGDEVILRVENSGPFVPPGDVEAIFEPFRRLAGDRLATGPSSPRARPGPRGVGLGLSIVRSVAAAHDGRVKATSRPGGGLSVEVLLPTES